MLHHNAITMDILKFSSANLLFQFFSNNNQHSNKTGSAADKVGDGFRQEYAIYGRGNPSWQQDGKRGDNDNLTQDGEENGIFRLPQRLKYSLA